jgi:hypothetical protein
MMELVLKRLRMTDKSTIGMLVRADDNTQLCWTIEDVVRKGKKIPKVTAIPAGSYNVIVNMSNRFKRKMCLLENVPNFTGIRIHGGNTSAHTDGCILVAHKYINDDLIQGTAEKFITGLVSDALVRGEQVTLFVKDIANGSNA